MRVSALVHLAFPGLMSLVSLLPGCGSGDLVPIEGPFGILPASDAAAGGSSAGGSGGGGLGGAGLGGAGLGGAGLGGGGGGVALADGSSPAAKGCKRGIAANTTPSEALFPSVSWWYNWSTRRTGATTDIEFDPMAWGADSVDDSLPTGSKFLLGFNEPSFHDQSNLSAQDAAALWPKVEAQARATGAAIVSPGVNFCGPEAKCNGTDPYVYLRDFFAACPKCKVDYVAVHWYNCDLASLRDYLERGGNLNGFEEFGRPIWLTEFSCPSESSLAEQEAYMRAAIPYLESSAQIFRYSWFSADPIPNARLLNADGSPTALGQVYMSLPSSCL